MEKHKWKTINKKKKAIKIEYKEYRTKYVCK